MAIATPCNEADCLFPECDCWKVKKSRFTDPDLFRALTLLMVGNPTVIKRLRDFVSYAEQAIEAAEILEAALAPISQKLIEREQEHESARSVESDAPG